VAEEFLQALLSTPVGLFFLMLMSPAIVVSVGVVSWLKLRDMGLYRRELVEISKEISLCRERLARLEGEK